MTSASSRVPDGTPRHESAGETSAPSQLNFVGMSPPWWKAGLSSRSFGPNLRKRLVRLVVAAAARQERCGGKEEQPSHSSSIAPRSGASVYQPLSTAAD